MTGLAVNSRTCGQLGLLISAYGRSFALTLSQDACLQHYVLCLVSCLDPYEPREGFTFIEYYQR